MRWLTTMLALIGLGSVLGATLTWRGGNRDRLAILRRYEGR